MCTNPIRWSTQPKADCEAVMTDCCYTGTGRYDCIPGNNGLCKCVLNPRRDLVLTLPYLIVKTEYQHQIVVKFRETTVKDDCSVGNISPTYIKHNGTYIIGFTQVFPLATTNILGLWLSGTFYNAMDAVKDPYDDCCYVLVCDNCHFVGSDIMNYSPSQIYQNHLLGKYYNGTQNPTFMSPEILAQNRGPYLVAL